ncbi:MAG: methyltransferase domain-containing protein [Acidobacteria bacterium]|nr:methyltransferase domain-containing protein [Acidobacteriota bacterium]
MIDFDALAATWDDDPVKVERARVVAAAIVGTVALPPDAAGFEYGCGTGLLGVALASRFVRLTLADSSEGMLAVLGRKLADAGLFHVVPLRLDLDVEPPHADRFDLVFSSMALHHVRDVPRVLRAFHELTVPGGAIALADLDAEDGSFHGAEVDVHHGFDRAALAREVERAGFVEPSFRTVFDIRRDERVYPVFLLVARRP